MYSFASALLRAVSFALSAAIVAVDAAAFVAGGLVSLAIFEDLAFCLGSHLPVCLFRGVFCVTLSLLLEEVWPDRAFALRRGTGGFLVDAF